MSTSKTWKRYKDEQRRRQLEAIEKTRARNERISRLYPEIPVENRAAILDALVDEVERLRGQP